MTINVQTGQNWSKLVKTGQPGDTCVIRVVYPGWCIPLLSPTTVFQGENGLNLALILDQIRLRANIIDLDGQIQDSGVQDSRF